MEKIVERQPVDEELSARERERMNCWIGQILDDRYELISLVGYGGMAYVYRAIDHRLTRSVAPKMIRDDAAQDESVRSRFAA